MEFENLSWKDGAY